LKFKELQATLGKLIVERAQLELGATRTINGRKVRRVASDALRKGLNFTINGKNLSLNSVQKYGAFIHYGVNGTKKKWGSQFSYKSGTKPIPLGPIVGWMRKKGVRPRNKAGGFQKQGPKKVKIGGYSVSTQEAGLAFAIGRKTKENGIAPLPYYNLAISNVLKTQSALIAKAIKKDVELLLNFD
jgi:hypothetical protein